MTIKIRTSYFTDARFHSKAKPSESEVELVKLLAVCAEAVFIIPFKAFIAMGILHSITILLAIFASLLSLLTFPIYFKVFRKNKAKEQESPIYPILQHFHRFVCFMLIVILSYPFQTVSLFFWPNMNIQTIYYMYQFLMSTVSPIFNFLLAILALQRFLIFFLPDFEKFFSFKSKTWKVFIILLYFTFFIVNAGMVYAKGDWEAQNYTMLEWEVGYNGTEVLAVIDEAYTVGGGVGPGFAARYFTVNSSC